MSDHGDLLAWHRLGTKLNQPPTAEQAVCDAGLNWTVAIKQLYAGEEYRLLPERCVLVREDLWKSHGSGVLGPMRATDVPFQNVEAFSFFDPMVKMGAAVYDSVGALAQGQWVWIMLRLAGDIEIAPGDSVGRYLLFGNSPMTGSHRLSFMPVRMVSGSTLNEHGSYAHNPEPQITVPTQRPRRFEKSIDEALAEIQRHFEKLADCYRLMLGIEMNQEQLQQYLQRVFQSWLQTYRFSGDPPLVEHPHYHSECIRLFAEGKGNDLPPAKGTLWAAYCAIAEFVDFYKKEPEYKHNEFLREVWRSHLKAEAFHVARKMAPVP